MTKSFPVQRFNAINDLTNPMLPAFSIIIPCFNEEGRIGQTLRLTLDYLAANAPESELIVVNDGSTDGTGAIARERLKSAPVATRLLENFPNRGKGAAVRSGLLAARTAIGLFSDADLSTPLEETPKLIATHRKWRSRHRIWFARAGSQLDRRASAVAARAGRPCF